VSALPVVTSSLSNYPALLNAAWQQHLAPRASDAPTVISTFAGCGGSSLGYSMAGYRELLAVEWDNNAVQTFSLNFPDVPVYHGDIAALSVDEVLQRTGLQPGELDVLDGSPPCQGFSNAGERVMDDPRNQLFREYVRLLRGLRPKVFVMENVSGMVKGKMKLIFADILRELKNSGYKVSARLLNAMYFHVPQSRERMIFIGVRDDLVTGPTYPRALSRPTSFIAAVDGCPSENVPGLFGGDTLMLRRWKQGMGTVVHGQHKGNARLFAEKPCSTLKKSSSPSHPLLSRLVSIGEMRRCQSFPDAYRFIGSYDNKRSRIGNSVPPLLMRAIASHIRTHILERATDA
jgi:DNA (cytosine-5)-methyltransferase 1